MAHKPDYEELLKKLAEAEEIISALRNQELDAVVGTKSVLFIRLKETEDQLKEQRKYLEDLLAERTRLLEDLKIHQVELETQAEELRRAQREAQDLLDKYLDLYDHAPVGYLTLDKGGVIIEVNVTATEMLSLDKKELIHTPITKLISPDSQNEFHFHMNRVFETGTTQTSEIRIRKGNGLTFHAKLQSMAVSSGDRTKNVRTSLSDITGRKKAEEELHQYREHLEEIVARRTRELRELSHRLVDAQEKERTTIGNELHDEIGQYLTYCTLLIDRASRKPDPEVLAQAKASVQDAMSLIRDLSSMLSPRLLKSAGLLTAVESLLSEYTRRTGIKVDLDHSGIGEVPEDAGLAIYRIIQESLTNVARHAQASEVKVSLSRQNDDLCLEVADNGIGFESGFDRKSTGLTGMRERAVALRGELTIDSRKGQGTRVIAAIPLSEPSNV